MNNLDDEPHVLVGARLAAARRNAELNQTELGALCGINQSQVSAIERGVRAPSIEMARDLATALGISVHWLIGDDRCHSPAQETGVEHLLGDSKTPAGLAALARDDTQCACLNIRPVEWGALRAMTPPQPLTKEGYLAVLLAFRGHVARC